MAQKITAVQPYSAAAKAGIRPGDELVSVNGREILDVLDYRFHTASGSLTLSLLHAGKPYTVQLKKREYDDPGLDFERYLMDEPKSCRNRCVFCFIDQNPPGMRSTIYFKDDDTRLSFLTGNYVTFTNVTERDIERIVEQRIMPINVSVQTTDPELRCRMLNNRFAGNVLALMKRLADHRITMNAQIVLCPGINDGEHLDRSLKDLCALYPALNSISVVPVGITRHREGLYPLRGATAEDAKQVLTQVNEVAAQCLKQYGSRVCYVADEWYLKARLPIPPAEEYEEFPQLENGVGMLALFCEEFRTALTDWEGAGQLREISVATGTAAYDAIRLLCEEAQTRCPGVTVHVYPIRNNFYGETVTVAGLCVGGDLIAQLKGQPLGEKLLIPASMLRAGEEVFLDDITLADLTDALEVPVVAVPQDGAALLSELLD